MKASDIIPIVFTLPILLGALAFLCYPLIFLFVWERARRRGKVPVSAYTLIAWAAMIALLGGLALPNFLNFCAKAKQSEAKTNLGAIFTTQTVYRSEHDCFAGGPAAFTVLNWEPQGQSMYAYFCGEDMIANTKGTPIEDLLAGDWPAKRRPASSATGFTCMAIGNIDNEQFPDVWAINDAKQLENVTNDLTNTREGEDGPLKEKVFAAVMMLVAVISLMAAGRTAGRTREARP